MCDVCILFYNLVKNVIHNNPCWYDLVQKTSDYMLIEVFNGAATTGRFSLLPLRNRCYDLISSMRDFQNVCLSKLLVNSFILEKWQQLSTHFNQQASFSEKAFQVLYSGS